MDLALFVVRIALALMWIVAAVAKLRNRDAASQAVVDFDLLPSHYAKAAGRALPYGELLLGLALFFNVAAPYAAALSLVLLCLFSGAIGINLARGRKVVCQCFGSLSRSPLSFWSLVGNLILMGLFTLILFHRANGNAPSDIARWRELMAFLATQKHNLPAVLLLFFSGITARELISNFYHMMLAMGRAQDGPMHGTVEDDWVGRYLRSKRT